MCLRLLGPTRRAIEEAKGEVYEQPETPLNETVSETLRRSLGELRARHEQT